MCAQIATRTFTDQIVVPVPDTLIRSIVREEPSGKLENCTIAALADYLETVQDPAEKNLFLNQLTPSQRNVVQKSLKEGIQYLEERLRNSISLLNYYQRRAGLIEEFQKKYLESQQLLEKARQIIRDLNNGVCTERTTALKKQVQGIIKDLEGVYTNLTVKNRPSVSLSSSCRTSSSYRESSLFKEFCTTQRNSSSGPLPVITEIMPVTTTEIIRLCAVYNDMKEKWENHLKDSAHVIRKIIKRLEFAETRFRATHSSNSNIRNNLKQHERILEKAQASLSRSENLPATPEHTPPASPSPPQSEPENSGSRGFLARVSALFSLLRKNKAR